MPDTLTIAQAAAALAGLPQIPADTDVSSRVNTHYLPTPAARAAKEMENRATYGVPNVVIAATGEAFYALKSMHLNGTITYRRGDYGPGHNVVVPAGLPNKFGVPSAAAAEALQRANAAREGGETSMPPRVYAVPSADTSNTGPVVIVEGRTAAEVAQSVGGRVAEASEPAPADDRFARLLAGLRAAGVPVGDDADPDAVLAALQAPDDAATVDAPASAGEPAPAVAPVADAQGTAANAPAGDAAPALSVASGGDVASDEIPEGFPGRGVLTRNGFTSLAQLRAATDEDLIAVDGIAESMLRRIRAALASA